MVRRLSDGGQSIRMKSCSVISARSVRNATCILCSRLVSDTISTSAELRSGVAGMIVRLGTTVS